MNFDSQERRIEHFQEAFRRKRQQTLDEIYKREQKSLLPITDREMYVAGLMLYWGEGLKASWGRVSFSNTNPAMILFAIKWLTDCCGVPREKLQIRFHFYSDMDIEKEHQYWQNLLNLPRSQFRKPYIKQSLRTHINEKGGFGHGTCDITVGDTFLKEKIMMGIKVISDSLSWGGRMSLLGRWRNGSANVLYTFGLKVRVLPGPLLRSTQDKIRVRMGGLWQTIAKLIRVYLRRVTNFSGKSLIKWITRGIAISWLIARIRQWCRRMHDSCGKWKRCGFKVPRS